MLIQVGKVERIIGSLVRVCACCGLTLKSCRCEHDVECFDTECPRRRSSF